MINIDKKIDSLYSVVSNLTVNKISYVGQSGYFADSLSDFGNLGKCTHAFLSRIEEDEESCFHGINFYNDEICAGRYFLPDSHIMNKPSDDNNAQVLFKILESSGIIRFHSCSRMRKQNLSEHMWKVAIISQYLMPSITAEGLLYALTHDCGEIITGDIPATCKWDYPELKNCLSDIEETFKPFLCTPAEEIIIKIADYLEGMLFCALSYNDGCKEALVIYRRWENKFLPFMAKHDLSEELLTKIGIITTYIRGIIYAEE